METIGSVCVIGMGEVGRRLAGALGRAGVEVHPVTRDSGWDKAEDHPSALRLICVREEALTGVLDRLSSVPPRLLAVVQNGWIRPLLGDLSEITRGLIWFTSKGDFFRQLRPSPFTGDLAIPLVRGLAAGGLSVSTVSSEDYDGLDAEKMGFNCVVGLPLAVSGLALGPYLQEREEEAHSVFTEAITVCAAAAGARPDERWWPDFIAAAEPLDWVATAKAKALEFRNQAVVDLAAELGMEAPVNARLLAEYAANSD